MTIASDVERRLIGLKGSCRRWGLPEPDGLAGAMWLERLRRELGKVIDDRPGLTAEQLAEAAGILAADLARTVGAG